MKKVVVRAVGVVGSDVIEAKGDVLKRMEEEPGTADAVLDTFCLRIALLELKSYDEV